MPLLCDIDELPYTFEHIWTNLLTQCTPVPVPVFCCFSISSFPHIKSAPKIQEKSNKNQRSGSFRNHLGRGGQRGPTRAPGALPARPRAGPRQGGTWTPGGSPGCPLRLQYR